MQESKLKEQTKEAADAGWRRLKQPGPGGTWLEPRQYSSAPLGRVSRVPSEQQLEYSKQSPSGDLEFKEVITLHAEVSLLWRAELG